VSLQTTDGTRWSVSTMHCACGITKIRASHYSGDLTVTPVRPFDSYAGVGGSDGGDDGGDAEGPR